MNLKYDYLETFRSSYVSRGGPLVYVNSVRACNGHGALPFLYFFLPRLLPGSTRRLGRRIRASRAWAGVDGERKKGGAHLLFLYSEWIKKVETARRIRFVAIS